MLYDCIEMELAFSGNIQVDNGLGSSRISRGVEDPMNRKRF